MAKEHWVWAHFPNGAWVVFGCQAAPCFYARDGGHIPNPPYKAFGTFGEAVAQIISRAEKAA